MKKIVMQFICFILVLSLNVIHVSAYMSNPEEGVYTFCFGLTDEEIAQEKHRQNMERVAEFFGGDVPTGRRQDWILVEGQTQAVVVRGRVAGQLPGGTSLPAGGQFFVNRTGGNLISASVSFPAPFGSISVSANSGRQMSAGGVSVPFPSRAHYIVYRDVNVFATPVAMKFHCAFSGQFVTESTWVNTVEWSDSFRTVRA